MTSGPCQSWALRTSSRNGSKLKRRCSCLRSSLFMSENLRNFLEFSWDFRSYRCYPSVTARKQLQENRQASSGTRGSDVACLSESLFNTRSRKVRREDKLLVMFVAAGGGIRVGDKGDRWVI